MENKDWSLCGQGHESYISCPLPDDWSYEIIQGVQCAIPPVGYVLMPGTSDLIYIGIDKKNKEEDDFYWIRNGLPDNYEEKRAEEIIKKGEEENYADPELEAFRQAAWIRRISGCWFANGPKGEPVYISGNHYFYLEWCFIAAEENNGYPSFRETDRRLFLFLEHCVQNPNSYGILLLTKRRNGKTQASASFGLNRVTRKKYANLGIQSKTAEDAEKVVFKDAVMRMFQRMPHFFQPIHDFRRAANAKNTFVFKPAQGDIKAIQEKKFLGGWIEWRSSSETAFDGTKLSAYIGDEIFKTPVEVDIYSRWNIVKYCLINNGQIFGKAMLTSTVEEIEGAIDVYTKFWRDSDHLYAKGNGKSKTGLFRFFIPGDEARNYDKYGYTDKTKNRSEILQEREMFKTDVQVYNSIVRKDPLSVDEAFRFVSRESLFNTIKISDQLDAIAWREDELLERGNLIWTEHMKDCKWVPSQSGRWVRVRKIQWPDGPLTTVKEEYSKSYILNGETKFVMGVDPYRHSKTESGSGSDGVGYIRLKHNPLDPDNSDMPVMCYAYRHKIVDKFHDDILITAFYLGCKVLFENQIMGLGEYFEEYGARQFLIKVGGNSNYGIAASKKTLVTMCSLIETDIENNCDKNYFPVLLRDIANFDINNTQRFDHTMAYGYSLLADNRVLITKKKHESLKMIDIGDLF
jgi:hypothetical protein